MSVSYSSSKHIETRRSKECKAKNISAPAGHPLLWWEAFNYILIEELPVMYANKENWWYIHHSETARQNRPIAFSATEEMMEKEWPNLLAKGLTECSCDEENEQKFWHSWKDYSQNATIVATLSFKRFLGEEGEDGNCKGQGLCPILYGLNILADGLTYVKVNFKKVDFKVIKSKDMIKKTNRKNLGVPKTPLG